MQRKCIVFLAYMFSIATSLTIFDQIRVDWLHLSLGQILLANFLVFGCILSSSTKVNSISREVFLLLGFWLSSAILFFIGHLHLIGMGFATPLNAGFEIKSLLLSSITSIAALFFFRITDNFDLKRYYCIVAIALLVPSSILASIFSELYGYRLWYSYIRLELFATNPNMLAMYLVPLPFFILGVFRFPKNQFFGRIFFINTFLTSIIAFIGFRTLSDALNVAWLITLLTLIIVTIAQFYFKKNIHTNYFDKVNLIKTISICIGFLFALIANLLIKYYLTLLQALFVLTPIDVNSPSPSTLVPHASAYQHDSNSVVTNTVVRDTNVNPPKASISNDLNYRSILAINGMKAMLIGGGLLGYGPGSFSGYSAPFEGLDTHNTLLEWYLSAGLLGAVLLIILLGWVMVRLVLRKQYFSLLGMYALIIFSFAHNIINYPFFWIILSLLILEPAHVRPIFKEGP